MKKLLISLLVVTSGVAFAAPKFCPEPDPNTLKPQKNGFWSAPGWRGDPVQQDGDKVVSFVGAHGIMLQYPVLKYCIYQTMKQGQIQLFTEPQISYHIDMKEYKGSWQGSGGSYDCRSAQVADCPFKYGS